MSEEQLTCFECDQRIPETVLEDAVAIAVFKEVEAGKGRYGLIPMTVFCCMRCLVVNALLLSADALDEKGDRAMWLEEE